MALTQEQIKAGYSTIPGQYDPVTGKPKSTLTPQQISQGYSTIPGSYSPITGQPITASGLTNEPSLNLSNISGSPPKSATDAILSLTNSASSYQDIINQARKQQADLTTSPAGTSMADTSVGLNEQYGINSGLQQLQALSPEIADLNGKIAKLDAEEQQALAPYINANVSQGFSMGMEGRIKRQYAGERAGLAGLLGAKMATAAMIQGNISLGMSLKNSTIDALTFDIQQRRQDMDRLYDFYGDFINSLEQKEQTALANARQDLLIEESNQREDYRYLLELMMDNPQAGITTTDTMEEATQKVANNPKVETLDTSVQEVNGRKLLINNQTGQVVKDLGAVTSTGTGIGNGVVGSITPDQLSPIARMVYDGTYKLSDITATDKRAIAPELQAVGYTFSMANEDKNTISYIANEMENVMKNWNAIPSAYKAPAIGNLLSPLSSRYSSEVATFKASSSIIGMALTRLFEKGRISDQDRIFYLSLMPKIGTTKAVAEAGKTELIRLLKQKLTNQIKDLTPTEGGDNDPLGIL